jgi:hypothetical protein
MHLSVNFFERTNNFRVVIIDISEIDPRISYSVHLGKNPYGSILGKGRDEV